MGCLVYEEERKERKKSIFIYIFFKKIFKENKIIFGWEKGGLI